MQSPSWSPVSVCASEEFEGALALQLPPSWATSSALEAQLLPPHASFAIYRCLKRSKAAPALPAPRDVDGAPGGIGLPRWVTSSNGEVWEVVEPVGPPEGPLPPTFRLLVARRYRLGVPPAAARVGAPFLLTASLVLVEEQEEAAGGEKAARPTQAQLAAAKPRLLSFCSSARRGEPRGAPAESVELRFGPGGITEDSFGLGSSTQGVRAARYELRAEYADGSGPALARPLHVATFNRAPAPARPLPAPASAPHPALLPADCSLYPRPPPSAARPRPAPAASSPPARPLSAAGPRPPRRPRGLPPSRGGRAAGGGRGGRGGRGHQRRLLAPRHRLGVGGEGGGGAGEAGPMQFMDRAIISALEALFLETRRLCAGPAPPPLSRATRGARRRPRPRGPRRAGPAAGARQQRGPGGAEVLLRRIDCAQGDGARSAPVSLAPPASDPADEALLGPEPLGSPDEEMPPAGPAFEASVAEAVAALEALPGPSPLASSRLTELLGSAELLASRYIGTAAGGRSWALPSCACAPPPAPSAPSAPSSPPSSAPPPAGAPPRRRPGPRRPPEAHRSSVEDLVVPPLRHFLSLARLAARALHGRQQEEPAAYAEALLRFAYTRLQLHENEAAVDTLFDAWAVLRRHGLSPSRAEARALLFLTSALARLDALPDAFKLASMLYWYEGSSDPEDTAVHLGSLEALIHVTAKQGDLKMMDELLQKHGEAVRDIGSNMCTPEASVPVCASWFVAAMGFLHAGRMGEAVRAYRRAVEVVVAHPAVGACPISDVVAAIRSNYKQADPATLAHGIRVAVSIHLLAGKALAALAQAASEYGRFRALFPPDHPRVLAVSEAAAACCAALAGPRPAPSLDVDSPESPPSPGDVGCGHVHPTPVHT
eukprot:tig00000441_g703.t1